MKNEVHKQKLFISSWFYFAYGEMHCAKSWMKICWFPWKRDVFVLHPNTMVLEEILSKLVYYTKQNNTWWVSEVSEHCGQLKFHLLSTSNCAIKASLAVVSKYRNLKMHSQHFFSVKILSSVRKNEVTCQHIRFSFIHFYPKILEKMKLLVSTFDFHVFIFTLKSA